jgi:tetratricopeptide (TPR) repeat protein
MEQDKGQRIIHQVEHAATDSEKLEALIELEAFNYLVSPNKQLELGEYVLASTRQQDNPEVIARAHLSCANALYRQSRIQPALAQASQALMIGERFNLYPLVADAHEALGRIYEEIGIYAEALNHLLEALRHYDSVKDHKGVATVYIDIGLNYGRQRSYQEALHQFTQALRLCERHELEISPVILSVAACFIAYTYVNLGDYDQAQNYVDRFLPIAEAHQYHVGISNAWVIRGNVYLAQTRYEEAAGAYARGLEAAERSEMQTQIAYLYKLTGELHYRRGKYDVALEWVHRAAETAERSESMLRSIEAYEFLPQIYIAAGRYQDATYAYQKYFELRQKIDVEQQNIRAAVLQTVYQVQGARMETNLAQVKAEALIHEIRQRDAIITSLDSFAQQVAHDLKNPLNIIQNYTLMVQGDLNNAGRRNSAHDRYH